MEKDELKEEVTDRVTEEVTEDFTEQGTEEATVAETEEKEKNEVIEQPDSPPSVTPPCVPVSTVRINQLPGSDLRPYSSVSRQGNAEYNAANYIDDRFPTPPSINLSDPPPPGSEEEK
uniref:Uncharacterized protein n=1 Tax=Caenorhabditis tropicalis TaxID=1561998 RepID=A0A1I7TX35_9PELO